MAITAVVLAAGWPTSTGAQAPKPGTGPVRQATFELRNEVKVMVPDGAQRLRMWMACVTTNVSTTVNSFIFGAATSKVEDAAALGVALDAVGNGRVDF